MADDKLVEMLRAQLHSDGGLVVYAVLDGASIPNLLDLIDEHGPEYSCLFSGKLDPELAETAPYLVRLEPDSQFHEHVLEHGWGRHWGVFAAASNSEPFVSIRKHFRTFLRVRGPGGELLMFRYYDPRVLRLYLPTCNTDETGTLFGPLTWFSMEGEDSGIMLRFRPDEAGPRSETVSLLPGA